MIIYLSEIQSGEDYFRQAILVIWVTFTNWSWTCPQWGCPCRCRTDSIRHGLFSETLRHRHDIVSYLSKWELLTQNGIFQTTPYGISTSMMTVHAAGKSP